MSELPPRRHVSRHLFRAVDIGQIAPQRSRRPAGDCLSPARVRVTVVSLPVDDRAFRRPSRWAPAGRGRGLGQVVFEGPTCSVIRAVPATVTLLIAEPTPPMPGWGVGIRGVGLWPVLHGEGSVAPDLRLAGANVHTVDRLRCALEVAHGPRTARKGGPVLTYCHVCGSNACYIPFVTWPSQDRWLLVVVRLPAEPSRHRVAVWRELRKVGALSLGPGRVGGTRPAVLQRGCPARHRARGESRG